MKNNIRATCDIDQNTLTQGECDQIDQALDIAATSYQYVTLPNEVYQFHFSRVNGQIAISIRKGRFKPQVSN